VDVTKGKAKPKWLQEIEAAHGDGILFPASQLKPPEFRSSGSIALDVALGGGWPKGRIIQVFGKESTGKTLLFELAAVAAQEREGQPSVLFDFESTFDPRRFEALGGSLDMLYVVQAKQLQGKRTLLFIEDTFASTKEWLDPQKKAIPFACIAFDSTAAMVSRAEYEQIAAKGEDTFTVAYTARALSRCLAQLVGTGVLARSPAETTMFFMSQLRDNFNQRAIRGIQPMDRVTGGRALPFYASVRVEVSRGDTYKGDVERTETTGAKDEDIEIGHQTKVRVRKNKVSNYQGRVAVFDIYTEGDVTGLDRVDELAKLGVYTNVIERRGSWFYVTVGDKELLKVQGDEKLRAALREDTKLRTLIEPQIRTKLAQQMDQGAIHASEVTAPDQGT
jgi:recombination protein RecA